MRYQWIQNHRGSYPLAVMCQTLQVSTSGWYDWVGRTPSPRQQEREKIAQAAARSHFESNRIYGYRKVWEDLQEQNMNCCPETVRRVLRDVGLRSRTKRKFFREPEDSLRVSVIRLAPHYAGFRAQSMKAATDRLCQYAATETA
jgi:putative transposase